MISKQPRAEEISFRGGWEKVGVQNAEQSQIVANVEFPEKKKKKKPKPKTQPNTNLSCLESDKVNRINSTYEKT